ncbi:MAG: hypothetical protein E7619_02410, partial [Ruminococcaceae bacterium]|nr:hypothetical protein [Oscillospiraceae bacterium]
MKNEIKNPMERYISNNTYSFGNGGTGFYCAECGEYCPCGNKCIDKDGREVCIFCYRNSIVTPEPDDSTPDTGHTGTFICSHCGGEFSVNEQNYVDPENTICNACYAKLNNR